MASALMLYAGSVSHNDRTLTLVLAVTLTPTPEPPMIIPTYAQVVILWNLAQTRSTFSFVARHLWRPVRRSRYWGSWL